MKSQSTTPARLQLYKGFAGLNTTTSDVAAENKDAQPFASIDNLWCSPQGGYLSNESPLSRIGPEQDHVSHIRFYASRPKAFAYAARMGGYTELRVAETGGKSAIRLPREAAIASCVFNRKVIFTFGGVPQSFDGFVFAELTASDAKGAKFCCSVANRLVLAGYDAAPTELVISRVNDENTLASDEDPGESSVIKAFRLNVGNLLGTADYITGIAAFESNRLAVFTNDRVLVYVADSDYTKWDLDERVNVNVGAVSHNTIAPVGDEVFFCSRSGVHALQRSSQNGLTVFTQPISRRVQESYRRLLKQADSPAAVSAFFDSDNGRYTVFFPIGGGAVQRLTVDIGQQIPTSAVPDPTQTWPWAASSYAGLTCGDALAGYTAFGSRMGVYGLGVEYETGSRGEGVATTPILWHGDIIEPKQSHALVLYASGTGTVTVDATDEMGRQINSVRFELTGDGDSRSDTVPLPSQFQKPFQHTYSGLRLRVKIHAGTEQVRIFALGVRLREI